METLLKKHKKFELYKLDSYTYEIRENGSMVMRTFTEKVPFSEEEVIKEFLTIAKTNCIII